MAETKPIQVKLVLLGEAAVGKSSLVLRFVNGEFQDNKEPTIGAAFLTQKCKLDDKVIKFEIWDTAGQERFHSLAPMYYRNAQAAVVAYDITKTASLERAKAWVKELQRQANPNIVIALVGNKLDLASAREVSIEEASAYAQESNLLFLEASAKTGENVADCFTEIAKKIPLENLVASRTRTGLNNPTSSAQGLDLNSAPAGQADENIMGGFTMPSYMPGVKFSIKLSDSAKDPKPNEVTYLYFVWNGEREKISITSKTTTEEIGGAILSICGLLPEDLKDICVSIWDGDKQILGAIEPNSENNPYSISVARRYFVPTLVTNQVAVRKAGCNGIDRFIKDIDKVVCDGSIYAPVPGEVEYVEKYKFTQAVKDSLKLPTFNNWEYEDNELVSLIMYMYIELDIPDYFNIELQTLYNFVTKVREHYNYNPFHCFKHGFCVFQMAFAIIHQAEIIDELTMLERLTLMTACLGHDLDHPGYNNAYQVNAKTDLAIIYNDQAPLENHHSAMLFAILNLDSCNLFKKLDRQALGIVRKGIIRCIMATDMAKHGEHLQAYNKIIPTFSLQDGEHRAQLLSMVIKCSDISTEVRPPHVADVWVNRLLEEFFSQSDREKAEGLPFLPFMDRDKVTKPGAQVGFLSFVVIPLYEALAKLYPQIEPGFIAPIKRSLDYYKGLQAGDKK